MKKKIALKVLPLQCAMAFASMAATGRAIAAESTADDGGIQEVVVTAQKRKQSINDVPMSITAISGDQLAEKGIDDAADLQKVVSGFRYSEAESGTPVYAIRGVGFNETSLGSLPNVPVYLDEVPLIFPIMTTGVAIDLERVEVLKGPQGTLFGQSATGGAVNYIAAKPTDTFRSALTVGYGSFDDKVVDGYVSGPLTDNVKARFAFKAEKSGPWQKSMTRSDELGRKDKLDGRILVDWQATDKLKLTFNLSGWQDKSEPQALQHSGYRYLNPQAVADGFLPASEQNAIQNTHTSNNNRDADWGPRRPFNDSHLTQFSTRADYDLGNSMMLTYIVSSAKFNRFLYADPDGLSIENSEGESRGKIDSMSHELRLAGTAMADKAKWLVGVNYDDSKVNQTDTIRLGQNSNSYGLEDAAFLTTGLTLPFLHFSAANNVSNQNFTNKSIFGALDYAFNEALKGHISARHTHATDKFTGCTTDSGDGITSGAINAVFSSSIAAGGCITGVADGGVITPQPAFITKKLDESNNSWRLGLDWKYTPTTLLYANLSKGYKGGSFPNLSAFSSLQYKPVVQESLLATEIGFKTTFKELKLQLDGAFFHYDYRNKQVRGSTDTGVPFGVLPSLINVPKSEENGIELQLTWKPAPGWTTSVNGTYIRSRIKDGFTSYDDFGALRNFDGEPLPNTPKLMTNADLQYAWGMANGYTAFVGGNVNYQSSTYNGFGENPELKIDAYAVLDLRAGLDSPDGRWRAMLWARNVTDKYYWINQIRFGDTMTKVTGMPRTIGATLTLRF